MDNLDAAVEAAKPYAHPTRAELIEALMYANASAIRLRGTIYHAREHKFIDELLDVIVGR